MDYIAVLSYEHLDNSMFLNAFTKALSRKEKRGIILHEDSEYTDRLIQTGMMREDARIRAVKDLNHRLVALFADQGISTIGLNGYQKELISYGESGISVDAGQFARFPDHPVLLLSNLIHHSGSEKPFFAPLAELTVSLKNSLGIDETILFSTDDQSSVIKGDFPMSISPGTLRQKELETHVPEGFRNRQESFILTSADLF
ncbi:hypothetical protein [Rhodohalobacter mucosus]|uniref:Uncharacterized protein n=1 Tax=Rhodohalobacter mucosus TaxID=2079485 RepID=A0A316TVN4_9BACT|nr:hypothetical protein [Rhodohalobacter mucosus]PWN07195.1 hypothetical protein DDZ15_05180 [Rhodohalobacter mucosus]